MLGSSPLSVATLAVLFRFFQTNQFSFWLLVYHSFAYNCQDKRRTDFLHAVETGIRSRILHCWMMDYRTLICFEDRMTFNGNPPRKLPTADKEGSQMLHKILYCIQCGSATIRLTKLIKIRLIQMGKFFDTLNLKSSWFIAVFHVDNSFCNCHSGRTLFYFWIK